MPSESPEERKRRLRIEKLLRDHPRRSGAQFTDANDHNPLVLEDCPQCRGTGKHGRSTPSGAEVLEACGACHASGITGDVTPFFDNPSSVVEVPCNDQGWVTCPRDQWRFTLNDPGAWTGLRHKRCGQKLIIKKP